MSLLSFYLFSIKVLPPIPVHEALIIILIWHCPIQIDFCSNKLKLFNMPVYLFIQPSCIFFKTLSEYSWFTVLCYFCEQQSKSVIQTHQFSSVTQPCPTLSYPMDYSTPGFPVHHQLPELIQTHVHRIGDAIQPPHPLLSPSPPALNLSQHQGLFKWVSSLHQMVWILEF